MPYLLPLDWLLTIVSWASHQRHIFCWSLLDGLQLTPQASFYPCAPQHCEHWEASQIQAILTWKPFAISVCIPLGKSTRTRWGQVHCPQAGPGPIFGKSPARFEKTVPRCAKGQINRENTLFYTDSPNTITFQSFKGSCASHIYYSSSASPECASMSLCSDWIE